MVDWHTHLQGTRTCKAHDMDVRGLLWGIRFIDRDGLPGVIGRRQYAVLYIEDDNNYHPKCVFDTTWLADLEMVAGLARREKG